MRYMKSTQPFNQSNPTRWVGYTLQMCAAVASSILLHGCYSYMYYDFTPERISIPGGNIRFVSTHSYYDSTAHDWKNLTGDAPQADITWQVSLIYEPSHTVAARLLKIDNLYMSRNFDGDTLLLPRTIDDFDKINTQNSAFCNFVQVRFNEQKYKEFEVWGMLKVSDFNEDSKTDTIPIHAKALLKKGRGSDFNR